MAISGFGNSYNNYFKPQKIQVSKKVDTSKENDLKKLEVQNDAPKTETCGEGLTKEQRWELDYRRLCQAILVGKGEEWATLMNRHFIKNDATWGGQLPSGAEQQKPNNGLAGF